MKTLREVQAGFKEALLRPRGDLGAIDAGFRAHFSGPFDSRIDVYHNNVVGSLSKALIAQFPCAEKLVGAEFLSGLARRFVIHHPPRAACLHAYGDGFAAFVASIPEAQSVPYLPAMITLERAMMRASHAKNDAPLAAEDMRPETRLCLRASAQIIETDWPVLALRAFCENPDTASPPDLSVRTHHTILVLRPEWEVFLNPLSAPEAAFLQEVMHSGDLAKACVAAQKNDPAIDLQIILARFMRLGVFAAA